MTDEDLTRLIEENRALVLSALSRHLHETCSDRVEDVFQEVWYRAIKALKKQQFREESKISTWLYVIARNEALRCNDKQRRKKVHEEEWEEREFSVKGHEERIVNIVSAEGSMRELPEKYSDVVRFILAGFNNSEIAGKLGIKEATVRSRLSRARALLREGGK